MHGYRFLEGIVTADLAFEATGRTLDELFENAALAVMSSQAVLETVEEVVSRKVVMENKDAGCLLFDFLNEIIFLKDAEQLIFRTAKISITRNDNYRLAAELAGEKINLKKHRLGNDLKAVTMHRFGIEKTPKGWKCLVVIDI